jgi:hypothetical protein
MKSRLLSRCKSGSISRFLLSESKVGKIWWFCHIFHLLAASMKDSRLQPSSANTYLVITLKNLFKTWQNYVFFLLGVI